MLTYGGAQLWPYLGQMDVVTATPALIIIYIKYFNTHGAVLTVYLETISHVLTGTYSTLQVAIVTSKFPSRI